MELTVRKMGNSVGVTFPSTVVKDLGLEVGQALTLSARGGRLVLVPKKASRPLSGAGLDTQGVVLLTDLRVMDLSARGAKRVESVPKFLVDLILDRVKALPD